MDRSFLSQPEVIAASREFVCIRLISYESEAEKAFVASLKRGEVANTAFALLAPDGSHAVRGRGPGRGPRDLYQDAAAMAKGMGEIADKYPGKKAPGVPALPVNLSAKVGLVVAASDLQPLLLVVAENPARRQELESMVAKQAWSGEFEGRITYASAAKPDELPGIRGIGVNEGVVLIEPDIFGLSGKVVAELPSAELETKLAKAMRETVAAHVKPEKTRRQMAQRGFQEGVFYETGIPVSGTGEARDRARYKKQLEEKGK